MMDDRDDRRDGRATRRDGDWGVASARDRLDVAPDGVVRHPDGVRPTPVRPPLILNERGALDPIPGLAATRAQPAAFPTIPTVLPLASAHNPFRGARGEPAGTRSGR